MGNYFVSMRSFFIKGKGREYEAYVLGRSFNSLVPCLFAHLLLGINCYVQRANQPPFKQLIWTGRILSVAMTIISSGLVAEVIFDASKNEYLCCSFSKGGCIL